MKMTKLLVVSLISLFLLSACGAKVQKQGTVFYPPLPAQPRVQYLTSFTNEQDLGKTGGAFATFVAGEEMNTKYISRAYDIASVKGKLYMTDRTFNQIMTVNLETSTIDFLRDQRAGATSNVYGICIDAGDNKYVADADRKQVLLYDRNDKFVRAYGEPDQFQKPQGVAVAGDKIYVADMEAYAIVVLDKTSGKTIQTIGRRGGGPGEFDRPYGIKIDAAGNLYVNDAFNFRIQKLDSKGKYLKEFGYPSAEIGGFARPKGFDVSSQGHLFVVDGAFENVQVFDPETTRLLMAFGMFNSGPGSLNMPSALYIDTKNMEYFQKYVDPDFKLQYLIITSNQVGEKKINVYGFGEWTGEKLPEMAPPVPKTEPAKDASK